MYSRMDLYDVAHDWANRTDNNASASSSNLFFASGAIYSYGDHFMIAKHVWNEQGEHAVLFTKKTYSRTTSKHVSIVLNASSHIKKIFVADPALAKDELFNKWYEEVMALGHHLGTARKPAKYLSKMAHVCLEASRYAEFFGYELPPLLRDVANVHDFNGFCEHLQNERQLRKIGDAKKRKKQLAHQKKLLQEWRSFKRENPNIYDGLDYLRFNVRTGQIETTQNVRFPLSAGFQLYSYIIATNVKGGCTNCGELFLERYAVIEVNRKFVRIGCHKVTLNEINRFANQQGWH